MYLVQYMPTIGYWLMDKVLFGFKIGYKIEFEIVIGAHELNNL